MNVASTDYPIVTPDGLVPQVLLNAMSGRATWLHGPAGCGKSAVVVELGKEDKIKSLAWQAWAKSTGETLPATLPNLEVIHLTIPQMESEDFVGVPFHRKVEGKGMDEERMTAWAPAEFLRRNRPVILFLDEVSAAETRVQKTLLQIVHERKVFNVALPEGSIIILAGNRASDRAAVKMVTFPFGNRAAHYTFLNSAGAWGKWAMRAGLPAVVVAWVNQNPSEHLDGYKSEDPSLAQLTSRSLEAAAWAFKNGMEMGMPFEEIETAITANIGFGAGVKLNAWLRIKDELPTLEEIAASPEMAKLPSKGKVDRAYYLASMLMDRLRQPEVEGKEIGSICIYMDRVATEMPEVTDALAWVGQSISTLAKEGFLPAAKMAAIIKAIVGRPRLAETLMGFFAGVNTAQARR